MDSPALWLAISGPLALAGLAALPGKGPKAIPKRAIQFGLFNLCVAVAAAAAVVIGGPLRTSTAGYAGMGLALYLDRLSAIMFVLVSAIGLVVVAYSRNYLEGDPGHGRFVRGLCLTLASVLVVIISGNLLQFALAWVLTSISLHQLLVFYGDRPAARYAARKKFVVSRCSDLCLTGGIVLLYRVFHSLDYGTIFAGLHGLQASGAMPAELPAVAALFGLAALLKSAQFPVHGWLLEVMETPTPVSALLHAGIINSGGFLILRFAPLLSLSPASLDTIAIVGAFTALFGSLVMLTQTSIKVSLAYSTIAQMGFMMLECGLGAFSAALLHIVGHSFYKAHAFLSSGSVVDMSRAAWTPAPGARPHHARTAIVIGLVLATLVAAGMLFGRTIANDPGDFVLGAILMFGLSLLVSNAIDESPSLSVILRATGMAALVSLAYFGLQRGTENLLSEALPPLHRLHTPLDLVIGAAILAAFGLVTVFQMSLSRFAGTPLWDAFYVHLANGFYVNTLANRLIVRFWPSTARLSSSRTASTAISIGASA